MKIFLAILGVSLLVTVAYGWTSAEQTDNSKDHPGHCYSETEDVGAMEKGEVKNSKTRCVEISCSEGGLINFNGCGLLSSPLDNCYISDEDYSKPYPDCCSKFVCNKPKQ